MAPFTLAIPRRVIISLYLLLLGANFFLWPVVSGIPMLWARIVWIACAAIASIASAYFLHRTLRKKNEFQLYVPREAVLLAVLVGALLLAYSSHIPPLAFSDEMTISLPGLMMTSLLFAHFSWIGTLILSFAAVALIIFSAVHYGYSGTGVIFLLTVAIAVLFAYFGPTSGLAIRYPPMVHLMQIAGSIMTGNHASLFRMPNVLWTMLLVLIIWSATEKWTRLARLGLLAGILLGPLGWTFRTVLYQACGEITLGVLTVFLLHRLFTEKNDHVVEGLLGITSAVWFLYRPTSLPVFVTILALLLICRRIAAARTVALIAGPVIVAWLLLAPIYTLQYGWFSHSTASPVITAPLYHLLTIVITVIRALPTNLSLIGFCILAVTTILALVLSDHKKRLLVLLAWGIALAAIIPQQLVVGQMYYGDPRLNVLLLLPLGFSIACLMLTKGSMRRPAQFVSLISIAALLIITPFDFITYTQHLRVTAGATLYKTPPEGYDPLPEIAAVAQLLPKYKDKLVIVAPQYEFIDWYVPFGQLTIPERDALRKRSQQWTTKSRMRPVVVQAPITTTYTPNLTQDEEQHLKDVREWALKQPHTTVKLGIEEAIIVQ